MFAREFFKMEPLNWKSGLPREGIHMHYAGPFEDLFINSSRLLYKILRSKGGMQD